jgi:hypothetical protein
VTIPAFETQVAPVAKERCEIPVEKDENVRLSLQFRVGLEAVEHRVFSDDARHRSDEK